MSTRTFLVAGEEFVLSDVAKRGNSLRFTLNDTSYHFSIERNAAGEALLVHETSDGVFTRTPVQRSAAAIQQQRIQLGSIEALVQEVLANQPSSAANQRSPHAPMPGQVREILVAVGDAVTAGQPLVVMEAMKLQTTLNAGADGVVLSIPVNVGDMVAEDALLVEVGDAE